MDKLLDKLIANINSPLIILLIIICIVLLGYIRYKDILLTQKDEYMQLLVEKTMKGTETLSRLATLVEILVNRGKGGGA